MNNIKEIYDYLRNNLTNARLQEMSLQIIDAYKAKNYGKLQSLSNFLFAENAEKLQGNKLFLKLIKYFHPDRINTLNNEITAAFQLGDSVKLEFYKRMITAGTENEKTRSKIRPDRFDFDFTEQQEYDNRDFGFDIHETEDDFYDFTSEVDEEMDFIKAVKSELLGNLDLEFELSDLEMLEGELNLADYGIADLYGLDYCRNIIYLNLSNNSIEDILEIQYLTNLQELYLADNRISDIDCLRNLLHLEILDLSGNDISDISALQALDNLKFADLRNNPVSDPSSIDILLKKGINVIYDYH